MTATSLRATQESIERALSHHQACGLIGVWVNNCPTKGYHWSVRLMNGDLIDLRSKREAGLFLAGLASAAIAAGITRERPARAVKEARLPHASDFCAP